MQKRNLYQPPLQRALLVPLSVLVFSQVGSGQQRAVTARIKGKDYSYAVEKFTPPKRIPYLPLGQTQQDTPENALNAVFAYMKAGDVQGWKNLWVDFVVDPSLTVPDETYLEWWRTVLAVDHYVFYKILYRGQTIFVTAPLSNEPKLRAKWAFKKVDQQYKLNRDLMGDDLMFYVDQSNFHPETGKLLPQASALFHFEKLDGDRVVDDSGNNNHGVNHGAKLVSREKGKAFEFSFGNYVEIPGTTSLSFLQNQLTIMMDLLVKEIPQDSLNDSRQGYFASSVLSRGKPSDANFVSIQIRRAKNDKTPSLWVVLGDTSDHFTVSAPIMMNTWLSLETTFDGRTLTLYLGAQKVAENSKEVRINRPGSNFFLGRQEGLPSYPFVGRMDELLVSFEVVQ